ncbi:YjbH domain-containing protein [Algicella marina]|uniref:YjbH domain-containing protein n=1 Tax=Algicella marina TaxID=2683284 RepID=A0A6P1T7X9_9RHOB|nr:YjbH domain-containing protein [Algicella marina]QHQ36692.1 YjbH domain-containing protein [Algicella marina]
MRVIGALLISAMPFAALAEGPTYNLYGNPGLIDLPSAEMAPDGELAVTYGQFANSKRTSINFQILPRVNGSIRFATIDDFYADGSSENFRSFDLRVQLLEEGDWRPGVAIGMRDIFGGGVYGAEYIAATKEVLPGLKLTGGIGWGRLGSDNGVDGIGERNPTDVSGQLQFDSYFQGDFAPFAGIEWATPVDGLTLTAEYVPDAYDAETANSGFEREVPVNFGITYQPNRSVALSGYYMYGEKAGFQLTFSANPNRPLAPQDLGTGPAPVLARAADANRGTGWAQKVENRDTLVRALSEVLAAEGIVIEEARLSGDTAELYISNTAIQRTPKAIGRTARILSTAMPASVETFRITTIESGLPTTTAEIRRSDMEAQVDTPDAGLKSWQTTKLLDARSSLEGDMVYRRPIDNRFSWSLNPRIPFSLFDPDSGVEPDFQLVFRGKFQATRGLSFSTEVSRFAIGSDQESVSTSTSSLPHVRSDSDLYFSGHDFELDRLTADYVFKPAPELYGRVSAGYLERMFAGISTELLWAPTNSDFAVGGEINYVQQRAWDDGFALEDYDVVTGHGSIYWDTGFYGLEAQLDVGRYLAGDWGATATLSRRFANGWEVSGYVTRTEVTPSEFGEGSYAKGVLITMPLRWGLPFESRSEATLDLTEFDRDGGARLRVAGRLHERIRNTDGNSLEGQWGAFWQ